MREINNLSFSEGIILWLIRNIDNFLLKKSPGIEESLLKIFNKTDFSNVIKSIDNITKSYNSTTLNVFKTSHLVSKDEEILISLILLKCNNKNKDVDNLINNMTLRNKLNFKKSIDQISNLSVNRSQFFY